MTNRMFDESFSEEKYLSQIQRDFALRASSYDDGPNGDMHLDLIKNLLEFCPPTFPLADIACGTGLLAKTLGNQGKGITGIDLSASMIEIARSNAPKATFMQARAEQLPLENEAFASVYCCAALVYFTDIPMALREMWRVLRHEGTVAYQAATKDSYILSKALEQAAITVLGEQQAKYVYCSPHEVTDTLEMHDKLLKEAGFVDFKIKQITVNSQMFVGDPEKLWEKLVEGRDGTGNATCLKVKQLDAKSKMRIKDEFLNYLSAEADDDGFVTELVRSWYVSGRKLT